VVLHFLLGGRGPAPARGAGGPRPPSKMHLKPCTFEPMPLRFLFGLLLLLSVTACSSSSEKIPRTGKQVLAKAEKASCASDMVRITSDSVPSFYIQRTPVTVATYEVFAKAAKYKTQAESFGNSGVFDYETKQWSLVEGAYYKQPFGPADGNAPADHPVTQVSFYDAKAFCDFYNMRLPSEREWEAAAHFKQPVGSTMYPWGDEIKSDEGVYNANVWQGLFPHVLEVEDGYAYTSPIHAYPAAPSGLYDMAGNVWEWVSDTVAGVRLPGDDVHRMGKGGSFLCEPNWCHGYLISGSTHNSSETGLFHTGFRCVCEEK